MDELVYEIGKQYMKNVIWSNNINNHEKLNKTLRGEEYNDRDEKKYNENGRLNQAKECFIKLSKEIMT